MSKSNKVSAVGETFTCIWCEQVKTFPGALFGDIGWACSRECYASFTDAYWRVHEPRKYGLPTQDQSRRVARALEK